MIGLGILIRILRRILGKPLANSGALPTRYYLHEILDSLDQDNIGQAVRLLRISKGAIVDKSRWELVRQQVLFRCRVLIEKHGKRIETIENRMKERRKGGRLPWRWFREESVEKPSHYEQVLALEKRAHNLLEYYERELKRL
jgi:hypothetical protein